MNVLPKGILTVMVATLIASILILWTGKSIAESDTDTTKVLNKKTVVDQVEEKVKVTSPAPPGPFFLGKSIDNDLSRLNDSKIVPVAPKTSVIKEQKNKQLSAETPKKPVSPEMNVKSPDLKMMKPPQAKTAKRIGPSVTAPEFKRTIPSFPVIPEKAPVMKQQIPDIPQRPKQVVMPRNKPIWTQKPPVNAQVSPPKPVGKDVSKRLPPTLSRPKNMIVPPPPKQRYMYVPMPMYPSNNDYPQAPAQGANYYPYGPNFNMPQTREQMGNSQKPNTPKQNEGSIK